MKKKQKTLRQLKDQCWKVFSEWIRRSHADEGGTVECYTCGNLMHWKESHAGHFVGGRTNAVLFDERIVRPQCPRCNLYLGGSYAAYTLRMLDEVGRDKVDELMSLKRQTVKFTRSDLEENNGTSHDGGYMHNPALAALQSVIEWTEDDPPQALGALEWYRDRMILIRNCARAGIQAAKEPRREQQTALDL